MAVVAGTAVYAQVLKPSKFGEYKIDLIVDDSTAAGFKKQGVDTKPASTIQFRDGTNASKFGKWAIRFAQKVENKDGSKTFPPPQVVDKSGSPVTEEIGNGSKVNVQYNIAEWNFRGKKGTAAYLKALQVVDLVPYVRELEFKFEGTAVAPVASDDVPFDDDIPEWDNESK